VPSRKSLEEKLAALGAIEEAPLDAGARDGLCKALHAANHTLIAKAARVAATCDLRDLSPEMAAAFDRMMAKSAKADKGCLAKTALAESLDTLEYDDPGPFLAGVRHVQMEPAFGDPVDTAAHLRGRCAAALARLGHPDTLFALTYLLCDGEPAARRAAVGILAQIGGRECELLLRLKVLGGDKEPDVVCACLSGLATIAPEHSMDFIAWFLGHPDPVISEGAALALGEARGTRALGLLTDSWEGSIDPELKKMLLLPIALTRCDAAFGFLIRVVEEEHRETASAAVEALRLYGDDANRVRRIRDAAEQRADKTVERACAAVFGSENE